MTNHTWRFFRAGGFDQVRIESGDDILNLRHLDQKLWMALSCPTMGIQFDGRTLALLDSDGDGRIRAPELLAAIDWVGDVVLDPSVLVENVGSLPLAAINDQSPTGRRILASARRILRNLGKSECDQITLDDTLDTERIFAATAFNGDGIIPPDAAQDSTVAAIIGDIMTAMGACRDRSGKMGIDRASVDEFYRQCTIIREWWQKGQDPALAPLGEQTSLAVAAWLRVRDKIEDYFTRCRLAAFDSRAADALNRTIADYIALSARTLSLADADIAAFPVACIAADADLPLRHGLNPAWSAAIDEFHRACAPLLGLGESMGVQQWQAVCAALDPYAIWQSQRPACAIESSLGLDRILDIGLPDYHQTLVRLLEEDEALRPEAEAISLVDKLLRLCRDLQPFLNNFVSFRDFYTGAGQAVFQMGSLYLDGRSCDLCVRVEDVGKHAALATLSRIYLVYCQCQRKGGSETMTIAAAFTAGEADQLMVGRNGVFYDRQGGDWDASVVRVVDHPISIRQAFWSPYRRLGRLIGETVEKVAQARAKSSESNLDSAVANAGKKATDSSKTVSAPAAAPFDVGRFAGIFAAMGLALGAMGTAIASVVTGFLNLPWWQIPLAVAGLVLAVSGPSMVIATLKLRQRTLGPILDACGWAVNAKARINIPFGTALTHVARLPTGSSHPLRDPFAERKSAWPWIVIVIGLLAGLAVLAWRYRHLF